MLDAIDREIHSFAHSLAACCINIINPITRSSTTTSLSSSSIHRVD